MPSARRTHRPRRGAVLVWLVLCLGVIITIVALGTEAGDALFLVMEYVDGSDLDSLVRRQGPLPISLACEMLRQAAGALQYAHEQGMVHRDVKPGNLLVPRGAGLSGGEGVLVKVVDFGLARLRGPAKAVSLLENCRGVESELGCGGRRSWFWLMLLACLAAAAVAGWQFDPVRHWIERHLLAR